PMGNMDMNHMDHQSMDLMDAMMDHMRMGSGTSWQPANSPMRGWMVPLGSWDLMLHGRLDLAYDSQSGPRGARTIESQNGFMAMAGSRIGPGVLSFRTMLSLEAFTLPSRGM